MEKQSHDLVGELIARRPIDPPSRAENLVGRPHFARPARARPPSTPASIRRSEGLGLSLGTVAAGLLVAWAYLRRPEPAPVSWLRALHNGPVNDYATYFAAEGVLTVAVLLVR